MDLDLALALSLQYDDKPEAQEINKGSNSLPGETGVLNKKGLNRNGGSSINSRPLSIVDDSWELIDPVPNVHDLFLQFNDAYFDGQLAGVEVRWSPRMTL